MPGPAPAAFGAGAGGAAAGGAASGAGFWAGAGGAAMAQGGMGWTNKLWNARSARKAWKRQKEMFRLQTEWQEYMSNTAWQRGVKDMRAAGINPLLAVSQGGASTPSGSTGGSPPQAPQEKAIELMSMMNMAANIELTNAQTMSERARTGLISNQSQLLGPLSELAEVAEGFIKSFKTPGVIDRTASGAQGVGEMLDRVGQYIADGQFGQDTGKMNREFANWLDIGDNWSVEEKLKWFFIQDIATQRRLRSRYIQELNQRKGR